MNIQLVREAKTGDEESLALIMEKYSNLINHVKRKYYAKGLDEDDFESYAKIGIWRGVERFDESRLKFKYVYSRKTKSWRIDEKTYLNKFSACLVNNIKREFSRIWRKEGRSKRKGVEIFLEDNLPFKDFDQNLLIDIDQIFKKMHKVIWAFFLYGKNQKEISLILNCSLSYIKKEILDMSRLLKEKGLISC